MSFDSGFLIVLELSKSTVESPNIGLLSEPTAYSCFLGKFSVIAVLSERSVGVPFRFEENEVLFVATGTSSPSASLVFFMTPCSVGGLNSLGENLMMLPLRLCLILHWADPSLKSELSLDLLDSESNPESLSEPEDPSSFSCSATGET